MPRNILCACAGFWSRHVGEMSAPAVAVPIQPAEHYHLHTKPVPDLPPDTPVVRDPDGYVYFRENEGRFLAGGFEPRVSDDDYRGKGDRGPDGKG